ncbi:MAG: PAS-domain containing protein [Pseudomonadota bacterium]
MTASDRRAFARLLPSGAGPPLDVASLLRRLEDAAPIVSAITVLLEDGTPFEEVFSPPDGPTLRLAGRLTGFVAEIAISEVPPREAESARAELREAELRARLAQAEGRLARLPIPIIEMDPSGMPIWANPAFEDLSRERLTGQAVRDLLSDSGGGPRAYPSVKGSDPIWIRPLRIADPEGTLLAALDADAEAVADGARARVMNTLADTFAHLTVGLAVFDNDQKLIMFNPALCVLLGLDTVGLAARPSFRAFLEALRQARMVPEVEDFPRWRERLLTIGQPGKMHAYQEDWAITSGQTLRVTGRHHGGGAVVFVFEDISKVVQLERRYRQEIEIGQTTLDNMVDGVAVFDTSGALVFANAAFEDMWRVDGTTALRALDIGAVTDALASQTKCDAVWARLRSYVRSAGRRTAWVAALPLSNGGLREGRFSTLPDGAVMALFRDAGQIVTLATGGAGPPRVDLDLAGFLADAHDAATLDALRHGDTAAGVSPDLAMIAMILRGAEGHAHATADSLLKRISACLAGRGLTLNLSDWHLDPDLVEASIRLRRVIWCMALSAASTARPGSAIRAAASQSETHVDLRLSAVIRGSIAGLGTERTGWRLLEHMVRASHGTLRMSDGVGSDISTVHCTLPRQGLGGLTERRGVATLV